MIETDENLMLAVRDGNVARLGELFDRHHHALHGFFARMTGGRATADDLVQTVFFRILKYRKNYRDDSRFLAWMFQIARNVQVDHFRKQPVEVFLQEEKIPESDCAGISNQEFENQQQTEFLERALLRLSQEKREVLVLSRYQGMKYEKIAELLGCEVGTIKVRVHRALKELREIYSDISRERLLCNAKKSAVSLRAT